MVGYVSVVRGNAIPGGFRRVVDGVTPLLDQARKKDLAGRNRELQQAQANLDKQKRLRQDLGPQRIKLKESIKTLARQVRWPCGLF